MPPEPAPDSAAKTSSNTSTNTSPTSAPVAPSTPEIAFDTQQIDELCQLDPAYGETLRKLVLGFTERGAQSLLQAKALWQAGEGKDAARVLHTMRGSFGTLGARKLAASALALEKTIHAQDHAQVTQLFPGVEDDMREAVAAAADWLRRQTAGSSADNAAADGKQGSNAETDAETDVEGNANVPVIDVAALEHLNSLLDVQDMAAFDTYTRLLPELRQQLSSEQMAALEHAMEHLSFEEARSIVAPLVS